MIWEMWQYLTTPTKFTEAKTMGYLKEAIAMAARAKRCQPQWNAHYEHCQHAILQAANRAVQKRKVLILGAGSLNDIPLSELCASFQQVILVDLVFLDSARKLALKYPNLSLVEHDVTESLEWLSSGRDMVQQPKAWLDDPQIDLVVSLNLVTQIPLIPVKWLMTDYGLNEEDADIVGKQLIVAHLNYLKQFSGEVCLIADRNSREFNVAGDVVDEFDPWWDIEPPRAQNTWDWEIIPLGEASNETWQKNTVGVSFL